MTNATSSALSARAQPARAAPRRRGRDRASPRRGGGPRAPARAAVCAEEGRRRPEGQAQRGQGALPGAQGGRLRPLRAGASPRHHGRAVRGVRGDPARRRAVGVVGRSTHGRGLGDPGRARRVLGGRTAPAAGRSRGRRSSRFEPPARSRTRKRLRASRCCRSTRSCRRSPRGCTPGLARSRPSTGRRRWSRASGEWSGTRRGSPRVWGRATGATARPPGRELTDVKR